MLRGRANPGVSPNPAKAPWYFMGLQELLIHFHPFFVVVVFPLTIIVAGVKLPYIKLSDSNYGIWFLSGNGKRSALYALAAGILFTILFIIISDFLPDPEVLFPGIPAIITTGFIPFILVGTTIYFFQKYLIRRFLLNRSEYIQSIIVIIIASYAILTLTGIFFRGAGMKLMWPWQI